MASFSALTHKVRNNSNTWSPHFQSTPLMTRVPIFIMAASSGPEAGSGAGAASFLDSSSTVAEPPRAHKLRSSSLLSVLGPASNGNIDA